MQTRFITLLFVWILSPIYTVFSQAPKAYWTFDDPNSTILGYNAMPSAGNELDVHFNWNLSASMIQNNAWVGNNALSLKRFVDPGDFGYIHISSNDDLYDFTTGTSGLTIEGWFRFDEEFHQSRLWNLSAMSWLDLLDHQFLLRQFYVSVFLVDNNGQKVRHNFTIPLNGLDRKNYCYYFDNDWHHLAVTYSHVSDFDSTTNVLKLYVDGICPPGFTDTIKPDSATFNFSGNSTYFLISDNPATPFTRVSGNVDELAIYDEPLSPEMIYTHYMDFKGPNPTGVYSQTPQYTAAQIPAAPPTTGPTDPKEFPPGYPNNVSMNGLEQIRDYPVPRYHKDNDLVPIFPWINYPNLSGSDPTSSTDIQREMVTNFGHSLLVTDGLRSMIGPSFSPTSINNPNSYAYKWVQLANNMPQAPRALITNWNHLTLVDRYWREVCAQHAVDDVNFNCFNCNGTPWYSINPDNIIPAPLYDDTTTYCACQSGLAFNSAACPPQFEVLLQTDYDPFRYPAPYIKRKDLEDFTGFNHYVYLNDGNGHYFQAWRNKIWSPAVSDTVREYIKFDADVNVMYLEILMNHLIDDRIDYWGENGEIFSGINLDTLRTDPVVVADTAGFPHMYDYESSRFTRFRRIFRDHVMNSTVPTVNNAFSNTHFAWYNISGNENMSFYKYDTSRLINTIHPQSGYRYSTFFFYPQTSYWWNFAPSANTGWDRFIIGRHNEINSGDPFCAPAISPGIYQPPFFGVGDENMVRPGQWLGLLKCMSAVGAEYFHNFQYLVYDTINMYQPEWYAWQSVVPAFAQAITSRYQQLGLFHDGVALIGDRDKYTQDLSVTPHPLYAFWGGKSNQLICGRQADNGDERFVITGAIMPYNNTATQTALSDLATINLVNNDSSFSQTLTFGVRRQGSTYIYDETNPADPVFYQLDTWHQYEHPSWWSKDFHFESEVMDDQESDITQNYDFIIKTHTPGDSGRLYGDYSNFTSYLTIPSTDTVCWDTGSAPHVSYIFQPRNAMAQDTLRLWIRARSKDGQATGIYTVLDSSSLYYLSCLTDTNWRWYTIDHITGQPILFTNLALEAHSLQFFPRNTSLELEQFVLTADPDTLFDSLLVNCCNLTTAFEADTVCLGDSTHFTNLSGTLEYCSTFYWDFGDGNTSTDKDPVHLFANTGVYVVTLIVVNDIACTDTVIDTIRISPVADFSFVPECLGTTTYFTDQSYSLFGPIQTWSWDFDDGNSSTVHNPGHQYAATGSFTITLSVTDTSGCVGQTSQNYVINNVTAAFSYGSGCTSGVQFTDQSSGNPGMVTAWFWDFGDGSTSTLQNPFHPYALAGNYNVTLIVQDSVGCADTVTHTITIFDSPTASFSVDDTLCHNDTVFFTDLSTPGGAPITSWLWNFGDGATSTQQNPYHIYAIPGNYIATLVVTDANGCSSPFSANVIVNPRPTPFVSGPLSGCAGDLLTFFAFTFGGPPAVNWYWDMGDGTTYTTPFVQHAYATGGTFVQKIVGISVRGCPSDTVTRIITITGHTAAFTANDACLGSAVMFTDQSTTNGQITNWNWDFGDGNSSTATNPSHTYGSTGTYLVTLQVRGPNGCNDAISQTVNVFVSPTAAFSAPPLSCTNSGTQFTDLSQAGDAPLQDWLWDFDDGNSSTQQNPLHYYANIGIYDVQLIVVDTNGCPDTTNQSVAVTLPPSAAFTFSNNCVNATTWFTDMSIPGGISILNWYWDFGDGSTSTQQHPSHVYTASGNYTVELIVVDYDGCSDTVSQTVPINALPNVSFSATTVCEGFVTQFTDQTLVTDAALAYWSWSFGDGNTGNTQNPSHIYANPGTYTVSLIVTDVDGCKGIYTDQVVVYESPTAAFTATSVCEGFATQFTDQSVAGSATIISWAWNFGDGNVASIPSPSHTYANAGTYTASLIVTDANGCKGIFSDQVTVFEGPTANFTAPADQCHDGSLPLSFTDMSVTGDAVISSWSWDFDDGSPLSALQHPSHTFNLPGTYAISLTVTDANGCQSTYTHTLTLYTQPTAAFQSPPDQCYNGGTTLGFTDLSTAGSGSITSWFWDFDDGGATSAAKNPTHTFSGPGTYTVSLTVTDVYGCTATQSITLDLFENPTVDLGPDFGICAGDQGQLTANTTGGTGAYSYSWSPGSATTSSISVSPIGTTNYAVTVTDANSCTDQDAIEVEVYPPFLLSAGHSQTICQGDTTILTASGGVSYSWMPGGATTQSIEVSPIQTTIYTLTAWDQYGCPNTAVVKVLVDEVAIDLGPDLTVCAGSCINLKNHFDPCHEYQWYTLSYELIKDKFGQIITIIDTVWLGNDHNLCVRPLTSTDYYLQVTDHCLGCMATDTIHINVLDRRDPNCRKYMVDHFCCKGISGHRRPGKGRGWMGKWEAPGSLREAIMIKAYPNPFLSHTTIEFMTPEAVPVSLELFDMKGKSVQTLFDDLAHAGETYKVRIDAKGLSAGMYYYKLRAGEETYYDKLIMIK